MDNNILISAPKGEGEIDEDVSRPQQDKGREVATGGARAWQFNIAKSWISTIENDASDYKNIYHRKRTTAKRLSTASSVADKTGLLTGVIAGSLAASGVGAIVGISLAACGIVSSILKLMKKRYSFSAKIYHMLYTSAAESAASLPKELSQALTDGELSADVFKSLEFIYNDFLRFINLEIQKAPGNGIESQEKPKSSNRLSLFVLVQVSEM